MTHFHWATGCWWCEVCGDFAPLEVYRDGEGRLFHYVEIAGVRTSNVHVVRRVEPWEACPAEAEVERSA